MTRPSPLRLAALLLLFTAVVSACRPPAQVRAGTGGAAVSSGTTGWRTKRVVTKNPPEALMADDGTICRVSPERFRDTAVGTMLPCNWQ